MQSDKQQPYFFNPGMTTEQIEDWLEQQKRHICHYNRLVRERAALIEQLEETERAINVLSSPGFEGKLSFTYSPNPLLGNLQKD